MNNDQKIWNYLKDKGLNDYACAGIEGNLFWESGNKPNNLENFYNRKFNMTDEEYTAKVDSGEYTNFVRDSAGFGIAQWTYWSRKQGLLDLVKSRGVSIADLASQLDYLWIELSRNGTLINALMSAKSVYEATIIFMVVFENPADQSDKAKQARVDIAQQYYDAYAGDKPMDKYIEVANGVEHYSKAKQGDLIFTIDGKPSNFKVKEFACHDGTDEILIDGRLVRYLQRERDLYGVTTINSAYRTPAYNAKVGGAPKSQHLYGKASDTVCKNGSPLEVAMTAEAMGMGGIGLYPTFTHIDTRDGKSRWDNRSGKQVGVSTFFKTIQYGATGEYVKIAQRKLGVEVDGVFLDKTKEAVLKFQGLHNLKQDAIIGVRTWTELMK